MARSSWIRVGVVGGLAFAVLEVVRLLILAPPPVDGSPSEAAAWVERNLSTLRLFPWLDAIGASSFGIFGIVLAGRLRDPQNGPIVAVASAGAALVVGISFILDATIAAMTGSTIGGSAEIAPTLVAAGVGVESMFAYPLALFLGAAGWLLVAADSKWLGWSAWVIAVGFLASGLLTGLDLDLELEGPLFMLLLVWIVVASLRLLGRPGLAQPSSMTAGV
jgi:hypothetical protein